VFRRFRQAYRWSNIVDLYFNRKHNEFLKEMRQYASDYDLTDYERVIVTNAKLLTGQNDEARAEFIKLSLEIDANEKPYLSLYCRASIADLENNKEEYKRLAKQANNHRSKRFDRTLPLPELR
jgi:patatin-like phospholipase/acyl hydrolase